MNLKSSLLASLATSALLATSIISSVAPAAASPSPQTSKLTWTGDSSKGQYGQLPEAGIMLGSGTNFVAASGLSVCIQGTPGAHLDFQVRDGYSARFGPNRGQGVVIPANGMYSDYEWLGVQNSQPYNGAPSINFTQPDGVAGHPFTTPGTYTVTIQANWVANPCA